MKRKVTDEKCDLRTESSIEKLLSVLFNEYVETNAQLMRALDILDAVKHPYADTRNTETRDFWIRRHIHAAMMSRTVEKKLRELNIDIPENIEELLVL